jgi:hypothetical protein
MSRVEDLEREVRASRARLSATLDELRQHAAISKPGQSASEYLIHSGAGQFVTNLRRDAVGNPLPLAVLAGGLAWLMFSTRSKSEPQARPQETAPDTPSMVEGLATSAKSTLQRVSGKAQDIGKTISDSASAGVQRTSDLVGSAVTRARQHPVAVSSAGAAVGVAAAAALGVAYWRYTETLRAAGDLVHASEEERRLRMRGEAPTSLTVVEPRQTSLVPEDVARISREGVLGG